MDAAADDAETTNSLQIFTHDVDEFDGEEVAVEDLVEEEAVESGKNLVKLGLESWNPSFGVSNRAKLVEILKNLHSPEVKIYSDASREFVSLLDGDSGGEILREYVQLSPRCAELTDAWRMHREKPGMAYILSLFAAVFGHPDGKSRQYGAIKKSLDAVARPVVEEKEKLGDVYVELNSNEFRRQNAALDLLASIVRRGIGLASDVAKNFDFKLPVLPQLSGLRKKGGRDGGHRRKGAGFGSTRQAFVGFAMSFLEVGNPRLLRWILQQRELYSGVLRGIGSDDAETVAYVLSTLRDKVLIEESLVPPGLRSVLFGSATLEQLSLISGNPAGGDAADVAHEVLVMVCTEPRNGLMPGSNLRGNERRLLDLIKKLKATEVAHHKTLLLAIVSKRLSLCSAYMDEFPYNLEPRPSASWFAAISLAADMISSAKCDGIVETLSSSSHDLVAVDDEEVQVILKCIVPHACSRAVINRGLLHSDDLVKHGSLRLVLESVKLLCYIIEAIDDKVSSMSVKAISNSSMKVIVNINGFPGQSRFADTCASLEDEIHHQGDEMRLKRWISLREYIQHEVRGALPDPQVLLKLLSSASQKHQAHSEMRLKRCSQLHEPVLKKQKFDTASEDVDIVIGGIDVEPISNIARDEQHAKGASEKQDLDMANDRAATLSEIWGLNKQGLEMKDVKVVDVFHSKLLDVLRLYLRAMPSSFDGSFDFFRVIPSNPLDLSKDEQQSLLSLLVEYAGQSEGGPELERVPESMYKHLQPLINILLHSQVKSIRKQAYILVQAALASSGAFDGNFAEIDAWLVFLPGYEAKRCGRKSLGVDASDGLSRIVVPFFCDAVSVVGNNLYKYQEHMRKLISVSDHSKGYSPTFSPLILCILQKCLKLLDSESGSLKLHERSIISLYVCNTIHLILQSQVDMRSLPDLISSVLNERFSKFSSEDMNSRICFSEWRPLINLLHFSLSISDQQNSSLFTIPEHSSELHGSSLFSVVSKVEEILNQRHTNMPTGVATAFLFSIICAPPNDVIQNFPVLLHVVKTHFPSHLPFLSSVLFLQYDYLAKVASLWPDMFFCSLRRIKGDLDSNHINATEDLLQNHSVSGESAGLSRFLNDAPFYALFPAVLSIAFSTPDAFRKADALLCDVLLDLLRVKLSEGTINELLLALRVILFWSYHMLSFYTLRPSNILEELSQMCFTLVDYIFDRILLLTADTTESKSVEGSSSMKCIQDIVYSVLQHPIINLSLSCSLSDSKDFTDESFGHVKEVFTSFSKENLHIVDRCVLHLLSKLYDFLLMAGSCEGNYLKNDRPSFESVFGAPKLLVENLLLLFKQKFELCKDKRNFGPLLPNFYMVRTLTKFMSPFTLLELVNWMFSKLDACGSGCSSAFAPAAFVCLYIADVAMEMLYGHLEQTDHKSVSCLFWDLDIQNSDIALLQGVYYMILHFATRLNIEFADLCLLKTLIRIHRTERSAGWNADHLPFYMLLSRMAMNSPMDILHHCIFPTTKVKAKALQLLLEVSPMHMSLFGQMFMGVLKEDTSILEVLNANAAWPRGDDAIILLPAALSYMKYHIDGNKQDVQHLGTIPIFYSRILLSGFSSWKSFVSRSIFEEEFGEFRPASFEDFKSYFSDTLLGKAVTMLHYYFVSNSTTITRKQRLEIIGSICPLSAELLDSDLNEINADSCKGILKCINESFAKMLVIRLLLSPPASSSSNEMALERESKRVNNAKQMFISIMVRTLDRIVRNFPRSNDPSSSTAKYHSIICFLEYAVLKNIIELSLETQTYLNQLKTIPFLNLFIRSSLLHRFNDPVTIKAIRCILVILSEGKFSADEILELLLGHSHFVLTITCSEIVEHPSTFTPTGNLLQPIPSILKSVDASFTEESKLQVCASEKRKIETIRLLRVLYHIKTRQQNKSLQNASRELLFLLLSAYGATLSETDLEILHLMNEIESSEAECKTIAEMDYLWGSAALKVREELKLDMSISNIQNTEYAKMDERRRMLFRENIPVDSKLCVMTILQFCYDRSSRGSIFSLEQLLQDNFDDTTKSMNFDGIGWQTTSPSMVMVQRYDPAFILRFSIHSLLMGYIEPIEFSRLGLLAITLVSISSPDEELRKLGYESLGAFKKSLENSQKTKETWQLQLLLTYLQNGISESWQRIPSVTAIFAAEASLTLLDTSHIQFCTISKFLMHSPSVNLQSIPLFQTLFRSSSVHFKPDRLWMLQLLCAGLNLADDAKIYKRDSAIELALSFYSSPVSDSESKFLILQLLKKCVKLPLMAHHLVKDCGLLSWLSSVLSIYGEELGGDKKYSPRIIELVLKVVGDLISLRLIAEWLQETALEQLSEISSYLYVLLVKDSELLKENGPLLNSMLNVMASTLRLSMKRKIYQPHFTLSLHSIFQLCQAIGGDSRSTELKLTMELGVDVILMNGPLPVVSDMDKLTIARVVSLATFISLWSFSNQRPLSETSGEEPLERESLISRILRWLVASIILGRISNILHEGSTNLVRSLNLGTLQSFLDYTSGKGKIVDDCSINETLAVIILYLQGLVRRNNDSLPSVIMALCLLLLGRSSQQVTGYLDENRGQIEMLCSKIHCPAETNPAWRWFYYQPWRDTTLQHTEIERTEEEQACRSLLIILSNAFGAGMSGFPVLSLNDVQKSGLFHWERDTMVQRT